MKSMRGFQFILVAALFAALGAATTKIWPDYKFACGVASGFALASTLALYLFTEYREADDDE